LIDEYDPEAGADDGLRRDQVREADAWCNVGVVELAGAAAVAVDAEIIQLLRLKIEDGALVVFLNGREVESPAGSNVCGEPVS